MGTTTLLLATTLLTVPLMVHAASPQCAITGPVQRITAGVPSEPRIELPKPLQVGGPVVPLAPKPMAQAGAPAPAAVTSTSQASSVGASPDHPAAATIAPAIIAEAPALAHIAATGAVLSDLGVSHGLRTVFASNAGQFMVFELAPDGQAAVAGLMADISVEQLQEMAGKQLQTLAEQHGLLVYFLRNGPKFQVFYATPDHQRLIAGVMWGTHGENLTQAAIADIPGTTPTVTLGNVPEGAAASWAVDTAPVNPSVSSLAVAEHTSYGSVGNDKAPQLWMFIDPQCSFSVRAMRDLQPYVASGRVRLHIIPLSILDSEDNGLSTRNARGLINAGRDGMVQAWETGHMPTGEDPEVTSKLDGNMQAAAAAQVRGTPTFVWRKQDGSEGRMDGIPNDVGAMIAAIGS